MKYLASGTKRYVFDLDNGYILKYAKSEAGIACNMKEISLYETCPEPVKKYLAPIIKHGRRWLVMKKYDELMPLTLEYLAMLALIESEFRANGIEPRDLTFKGKPIMQNFRLDEHGSIIVIDYGSFKDIEKSVGSHDLAI